MFIRTLLTVILLLAATPAIAADKRSAIFFHPDGMGVNAWNIVRYASVGPQGRLNWDKLPHIAVYTGNMKDALTATSHGGATSHAYGVKVPADSFGMNAKEPLLSASGNSYSLLGEAQRAGKMTLLIQSGDIIEPGTAVFAASVPARNSFEQISEQVIGSKVDVIMSGGEQWLLPVGTIGRFGEGKRTDGRNLIKEAQADGYQVIYTASELKALDPLPVKLLGVFASAHTFNDETEEDLAAHKLPLYLETAPTIGEMVAAALKIAATAPQGFFMVVEEEGTDNFGNKNNALGLITAGQRADAAIGVMLPFIAQHPEVFMMMASDSDAGGPQLVSPGAPYAFKAETPLPERDKNGAPLDGRAGTSSLPFQSAGINFGISWATGDDVAGGILVRAAGNGAEAVSQMGVVDNTDVYKLLRLALFD